MKIFLSIFTVLLALLTINSVYAANIDNYNADFHIVKGKPKDKGKPEGVGKPDKDSEEDEELEEESDSEE